MNQRLRPDNGKVIEKSKDITKTEAFLKFGIFQCPYVNPKKKFTNIKAVVYPTYRFQYFSSFASNRYIPSMFAPELIASIVTNRVRGNFTHDVKLERDSIT